MILDRNESLQALDSFFKNESSVLNLPELIRMDADTGYNLWNKLIINNSNLQTLDLNNLEQSPYILMGENLTEINLQNLQQVEFYEIALNSSVPLYTQVLQNTKIQILDLPKFVGTVRPLPQGSDDISYSSAQYASFWNNYWLTDVSLGNSKMSQAANSNCKFNGFWFRNNYFLRYLRLNYPYVIPLVRTAGFNTTPIGNGNGYIYVPDDLVENYRHADNWSILGNKIKGLSNYEADLSANADTITKSWEDILEDCKDTSNIDKKYQLGQTKSVKIFGVPRQYRIVGINRDKLSSDNTKTAALSWLETTITNFTAVNLADSFNNDNTPRQYANAANFRGAVTSIYNGIEETVRNGIKQVIKYSKGYDRNNSPADFPSQDYLWVPSAVELNKGSAISANSNPYPYFTLASTPEINYHLGATNLGEINNERICVALRDYTSLTNYPDVLRSVSTGGMDNIAGNNNRSYLLTGFCT